MKTARWLSADDGDVDVRGPRSRRARAGAGVRRGSVRPLGARERLVLGRIARPAGEVRPAIGVVMDGAYRPLVIDSDGKLEESVIRNQIVGNVGASLVLWDRLRLGFNLPVAVFQDGHQGVIGGVDVRAAEVTQRGRPSPRHRPSPRGHLRRPVHARDRRARVRPDGPAGQLHGRRFRAHRWAPRGRRRSRRLHLRRACRRRIPRSRRHAGRQPARLAGPLRGRHGIAPREPGVRHRPRGVRIDERRRQRRFLREDVDSGGRHPGRTPHVSPRLSHRRRRRYGPDARARVTGGALAGVARVGTCLRGAGAAASAIRSRPRRDRRHGGRVPGRGGHQDRRSEDQRLPVGLQTRTGSPTRRTRARTWRASGPTIRRPTVARRIGTRTESSTRRTRARTWRASRPTTRRPTVAHRIGTRTESSTTTTRARTWRASRPTIRRPTAAPTLTGTRTASSTRATRAPTLPGPKNADPKKNGCPQAYIQAGQIKIREQVKFATSSAAIVRGKDSEDVLQAVKTVLLEHPEIKVRIEGHTDNVAWPELNRTLSKHRAESVMKWLVQHGIDASRFTTQGFGPTGPSTPTRPTRAGGTTDASSSTSSTKTAGPRRRRRGHRHRERSRTSHHGRSPSWSPSESGSRQLSSVGEHLP